MQDRWRRHGRSLIDTLVFSTFAWVIFSVSSLSLETVLNSYMINAIKIRIILTVLSIPVFYLVRKTIITKVLSAKIKD